MDNGSEVLVTNNNNISIEILNFLTTYEERVNAEDGAGGGGGKFPSSKMKYHDSESSNEFTNEMHVPELMVILLIIVLWILSLRKLVKHFDKLRSTQYREIPYKYRMKDPENLNHIKIVNNQNESVIYSRDPIKSLRSKSIAACANESGGSCSMSGASYRKGSTSFAKFSTPFQEFLHNSNETKRRKASEFYPRGSVLTESLEKSLFASNGKHLSTSLNNLNVSNGNMLPIKRSVDCLGPGNDRLKKAHTQDNAPTSNLLNPALLSPFIRRSLLDLHQKSVENLAAAAATHSYHQSNSTAASSSANSNPPTTATTTKRSRFKMKPIFNFRLRDEDLFDEMPGVDNHNHHNRSNNKLNESPV